jgi:uncharacterized protein (TIGR00369 family)
VAFAKLTESVRRNELLVLASLLAGLVMALLLMSVTWVTGAGLWAFPGYVAATAFRSMQAGGTVAFGWPEIAAGFGLHLAVTLLLGGVFAWISPRLREALGLGDVSQTPAYGLVGLGFGLGAFATAWWGVLPYVNPLMVQGLDAGFFAIAHAVWGLCLGVTRKAWNQTTPYTTRQRASPSPEPTPATSSHKAPSTGGAGPTSATSSEAAEAGSVTTLQPDEDDQVDEEPEAEASTAGDERVASANSADSDDELSPWPDPPEPDDYEDQDGSSDNGYASRGSSSTTRSTDDEDDEDDGIAMTEHARRSLRGLTDREPDLPPVHRALDTTLTHVAPGRAVCTIDAEERLHDATGAVQSGVLISLAELAATIAMETVAPEAEHATVGSEVQVDGFVEEGHVVAEAEVTEEAGTTTLAEAEVRNAAGEVLVTASFQAVRDDDP